MGDRTSHGGVVISGDPAWTVDGQPVARVGDKVSCPRCKRTSTIISSRFQTVIDRNKPVAFDQDVTDCGALLYSRHNNHAGYSDDNGEKPATNTQVRESDAVVENYKPEKSPRFQEHFILRNNETGEPLAGVPYTVKTGDGRSVTGETDSQGRTEIVWADSPKPIEVVAHPRSGPDADPYHFDDNIDYGGL